MPITLFAGKQSGIPVFQRDR
jgi:hypothetical protein